MTGNRNTVQRSLVLDAVKHLYHPTADEVYGRIAISHPTVSKATVYRNLNLLADKGLIRRVQLLDAAVRFDGNPEVHFHAQCRACGQVLDVMTDRPDSMAEATLALEGFLVEEREVLFRGVCAACRRNTQRAYEH